MFLYAVMVLMCQPGGDCDYQALAAWQNPSAENIKACSDAVDKWAEKGFEAVCAVTYIEGQ